MSITLFTKACHFAAFKHRHQRRKNVNIPYINHPLEVANILASAGVEDVATLCAAVLHDTLEDTQCTREELVSEFGEEIAHIVDQCSDDKKLDKVQRKRQQIAHSFHASPKAKLVKLADKISNNENLIEDPIWSKERVTGYAIWSNQVFQNIKGGNKILDDRLYGVLQKLGAYQQSPEQQKHLLEEYYKDIYEKK